MSYITYSVTRKDLENYYTPKKDVYDLMTQSINSNTNGYGQVIYNFTTTFDNSINSFNIWDSRSSSMIIVTSDGLSFTEADAGPMLWGVTSQEGLDFLNGTFSIRGLTKLKYCNTCQGRNGLATPTIQSFSSRFASLNEMMDDDLVNTGFLFYDFALPKYQNYYPSVYSTNVSGYKFRNWQKTPKTEIQVAEETAIRPVDITASLQSAEPIIPIVCDTIELSYSTTPNNVCDLVQLQYNYDSINNVLYINESCGSQTAAIGYYSDGKSIFYWDGVNFDKFNICARSSTIRHCCNETVYVIDGFYPVGTVLYTKDVFPAECFNVIGIGTDDPTTTMAFVQYKGDCRGCTASYGGGCGGSGSSGGGR
jgi:hypothetical protein